MTKRKLFDEINEGFECLKKARLGKTAFSSVKRDFKTVAMIHAEKVTPIREGLNLSKYPLLGQ